jgi:hypothetical protein
MQTVCVAQLRLTIVTRYRLALVYLLVVASQLALSFVTPRHDSAGHLIVSVAFGLLLLTMMLRGSRGVFLLLLVGTVADAAWQFAYASFGKTYGALSVSLGLSDLASAVLVWMIWAETLRLRDAMAENAKPNLQLEA